ncbi:MAG: hypothetical protein HOQ13_04505 [Dermatophilaceae bacterium]|nr:hypothetical protein [Dermatophilaceae bacterium]
MKHDLIFNIATVLVAVGAVLAWTFVFMYRRVDWRATDAGRHLMGFTLMVAIILTLATETRIFGPYPAIQYVAAALYGWLVWLLWSRVLLLVRANREEG